MFKGDLNPTTSRLNRLWETLTSGCTHLYRLVELGIYISLPLGKSFQIWVADTSLQYSKVPNLYPFISFYEKLILCTYENKDSGNGGFSLEACRTKVHGGHAITSRSDQTWPPGLVPINGFKDSLHLIIIKWHLQFPHHLSGWSHFRKTPKQRSAVALYRSRRCRLRFRPVCRHSSQSCHFASKFHRNIPSALPRQVFSWTLVLRIVHGCLSCFSSQKFSVVHKRS